MGDYKVYVHINKINGKRYYGITKQNPKKRWENGKGYKNNEHFARAIQKYGWNGFEHIVITKGLSEEDAKWLEIELIREWNTANRKHGYNISLGGESWNHSKETKKKISKNHANMKGKNHPMYGKIAWNRGITHTDEVKKKISKANKGRVCSEEHREKIRKANKGKNKGKNSGKAKRVYCIELDRYFDTIKEGAEFVGCDGGNISNVLNGSRKKAGGCHWMYAKDVEKIEEE